jgi:enoyl-CoA hydratase
MAGLVKKEIEGRIATVKLSLPEKLNILSPEMIDELKETFESIAADDNLRVVILTGEGKAFAAGADIKKMSTFSPLQARDFAEKGQELLNFIENMEKPVIAAINGYALGGGCELAMACDIRVAARSAKIGQPEVRLGLIPGFAGTQRMLRLVGPGMAKKLIFTGEHITAEEAFRIGLVDLVVDDDKLMEEAKSIAKKILGSGKKAVALAKAVINMGRDSSFYSAIAHEREAFALLFSTDETKEGLKAFLEKRKPKWIEGE